MNGIRGTGVRQHVGADQQRAMMVRFDGAYGRAVRERKHLWIATFAYYITPPLHDDYPFDVENLAQGPAIGCYVCEQEWSEDAPRRCPGEPK